MMRLCWKTRQTQFITGKKQRLAKNVDKERSKCNKVCVRESIKQVYHILFDEALEIYNAKQSRADHRIDNYYEKIL